jgi:hypothetical protein
MTHITLVRNWFFFLSWMPRLLALQIQRFGRPPRKRFPVLQSYLKHIFFFKKQRKKMEKKTNQNKKKMMHITLVRNCFFFLSWMPRLLALQTQRFGRPPRKRFPVLQSYLKQTNFFVPVGGTPWREGRSRKARSLGKTMPLTHMFLVRNCFFLFFRFICSPCRLRGLADLRESAFLYYNPI